MRKRYKVVGTAPILEHQPGETFEAELFEEQEKFLVGIGGLEVVESKPAEKPNRSWLSSTPQK